MFRDVEEVNKLAREGRFDYLVIESTGTVVGDICAPSISLADGSRFTGSINHDFGGEFEIAGWPDAETIPDVAACHEADQYLVTWQSLQGGTNDAIYGRFLDGSATPGNVYKIDDTTGAEREPSVSCSDGSGVRTAHCPKSVAPSGIAGGSGRLRNSAIRSPVSALVKQAKCDAVERALP